jgi:molybdopterin-guanine dinucleotide biosynthesis protein A
VKPTFTAALLAGGKSRRMGRDKAFLPVEWNGVSMPLWERQLSILKSVAPDKLVISGTRKQGYPESVPVLPDEWKGAGPLGGIATCLSRIQSALLLVLAIDFRPEFLRKLLVCAGAACGVVPIRHNRFEPLIAVYPRAALGVAITQFERSDYVLQHFVDRLLKCRLLIGYEVATGEQDQLSNWNTPEDLERSDT